MKTTPTIEEQLKRLSRRVDSLQTSLDILNNDRAILEDIVSRLGALEHSIILNKQHQAEMNKDVLTAVQTVKHEVSDKVDETKELVDDKTMVVKSSEGIIKKITHALGGDL